MHGGQPEGRPADHSFRVALGIDHQSRSFPSFVFIPFDCCLQDGNALYEAVAVIFIAQLNNITLSIPEVITVRWGLERR